MIKGKFETGLGCVNFDSCICNASGPRCTQLEELLKINDSKSCMVLSKSATLEYRKGNEEPSILGKLKR